MMFSATPGGVIAFSLLLIVCVALVVWSAR